MVSTSSHETEVDHQLSRQPGKSGQEAPERDVEQGSPGVEQEESSHETTIPEKDEDQWIVKWDGPDDPQDPLNTPGWQKWWATSYSSVRSQTDMQAHDDSSCCCVRLRHVL